LAGRRRGLFAVAAPDDEIGVDPCVEVGELDAQASAQLRGGELAVGDGSVDGVGREAGGLGDLGDGEESAFGHGQAFTSGTDLVLTCDH